MIAINLNSVIINPPHVAADYHPATTSAFRLGAYAAQLGEPCAPNTYFIFPQDRKDYVLGFRSVAKANEVQQ